MSSGARGNWSIPKPTKKEVGLISAQFVLALLMFAAALYFWFSSQKQYGNTAGVAALVLAVLSGLNMAFEGKKPGKPTAKGGGWIGWTHADGTPATDAELGQIAGGTIPGGLTPVRVNDGQEFPDGTTEVGSVTSWPGFVMERVLEVGIAVTVGAAILAHWPTQQPANPADPTAATAPVDPVQAKLAEMAEQQRKFMDEVKASVKPAAPVTAPPTADSGQVPFPDDLKAKVKRNDDKSFSMPKVPGLRIGIENHGAAAHPLEAGQPGVTESGDTVTYTAPTGVLPAGARVYLVPADPNDKRRPSAPFVIPAK